MTKYVTIIASIFGYYNTLQHAPLRTCKIDVKMCEKSYSNGHLFRLAGQLYHFSPVTPVQQTFSFGDKLRLTYNGGVAQNVEVVAASFDAESSSWEYDVILLDGSVLTVRKEFLSPLDEPDLVEIPITLDEVQAHIDKLDPATVETLLNPAAQSDKVSDFLGWHIHAGHLPFKDMATLSDHGYLPPHFKKIALR